MNIYSYEVFFMYKNTKELIKTLNCDELCSITEKRELDKKKEDKKTKKIAKKEMNSKLCEPCF
jgi:ABC-type uncharacterized transport system substrate-binding protein